MSILQLDDLVRKIQQRLTPAEQLYVAAHLADRYYDEAAASVCLEGYALTTADDDEGR